MRITKEMPLAEWRKRKFPDAAPSIRTLQRQCQEKIIPAVKRGGWYVLYEEAERLTGDPLVDKVLAE